jgi:hypothetical protein
MVAKTLPLTVIGAALGMSASFVAARWIASLLFGRIAEK